MVACPVAKIHENINKFSLTPVTKTIQKTRYIHLCCSVEVKKYHIQIPTREHMSGLMKEQLCDMQDTITWDTTTVM